MTKRIIILAAAVVLVTAWTGSAQDVPAGSNAVWNNATAGGLNARAPGNLVTSGLIRHNDNLARAFGRPEITQTAEESKIVTQLKVAALEALFDTLNTILLFFDNAIRLQAGFAPYLPNPIRADGSGGFDPSSLDIEGLLGGS